MKSLLVLLCAVVLVWASDEVYFSIAVKDRVPTTTLNQIANTEPHNYHGVTHVEVTYPVYQHLTIFLVRTMEYRDRCLYYLRAAELFNYEVELSLQHEYAAIPPWHKDRVDQPELPLDHLYHSVGTGAGVDMIIIDSGINWNHNEFGGRVVRAWRVEGEPETPCGMHGSWVASIAGGTTLGIASTVRILDVRVARNALNCAFYTSDAINALAWVAANSEISAWGNISNPGVINLSWIGPGNSIIDTLVGILYDMGFVVVAAAGNSGSALEPCGFSPARASKAIAVGATGRDDRIADFSNYGSCVDIFAPGVDISGASHNVNSGFVVASGTSGAAPIVASIAAMLYSREDFTTAEQVTDLLRIIAVTGVIPDIDPASPNRLVNFYPIVPQSAEGMLEVVTTSSSRLSPAIF